MVWNSTDIAIMTIMSILAKNKTKQNKTKIRDNSSIQQRRLEIFPNGNGFEAQKRQTKTLSALAFYTLKYRKKQSCTMQICA